TTEHAPVAQRIERLTTDQKVWGSNPYGRTNIPGQRPGIFTVRWGGHQFSLVTVRGRGYAAGPVGSLTAGSAAARYRRNVTAADGPLLPARAAFPGVESAPTVWTSSRPVSGLRVTRPFGRCCPCCCVKIVMA